MARTIGIKNVNLVKKLTREEVKKNNNPSYINLGVIQSENTPNIEDTVIEKLDSALWDIWESADAEIRRIIWDTTFEEM